ncbi:MAG: hypothetical protein LLF28_08140 [Nitrospiraceae bacterium]|nr:hypothetical protein [Nitrospiraceae bacterium]
MMMLNERGGGFLKFLITAGIIAFVIYAGIQLLIPFYNYSAFKTNATEIARVSLGNLEKTKAEIFESAQEHNIPVTEKEIEIEKTIKGVHVKTEWKSTVDLLGIYQHTYEFKVDVEA